MRLLAKIYKSRTTSSIFGSLSYTRSKTKFYIKSLTSFNFIEVLNLADWPD